MFPDHLPHKTIENIKLEMELLDFCRKASRKISNEIPKTMEKCQDFYKWIHQVYEKCQIHLVQNINELPNKDQRMEHLQDSMQEDLEYIRKVDSFIEEDIHHFVGKASINAYLLEDMCKSAAEEVERLET